MRPALEEAGFSLRLLSTFDGVRMSLAHRAIDLLIADMSGNPGEALALLRSTQDWSNLRLGRIALTRPGEEATDVPAALQAGADLYVPHPHAPEIVVACARSLAARAARQRSPAWGEALDSGSLPPLGTDEYVAVQARSRPEGAAVLRGAVPARTRSGVLDGPESSGPWRAVLQASPADTADGLGAWSLFRVLSQGLARSANTNRPLAVVLIELSTRPRLESAPPPDLVNAVWATWRQALQTTSRFAALDDWTTCAIVLGADEAEAIRRAKQVIASTDGCRFPLANRDVVVRVRCGIAIAEPGRRNSPHKLIDTASRALSEARRSKRVGFWVEHVDA